MFVFRQLNHSLRILVLQDIEIIAKSLTNSCCYGNSGITSQCNFVSHHPNTDFASEASESKNL